MSTYTLIQSQTLASSAASVTFSAIPGTYTDLCLKASIRSTATGSGFDDYLGVQFNGITTSVYSRTNIYSTAASKGSTAASDVFLNYGVFDDASNTSNTFNSIEMYVPSYTASQSKPNSFISMGEQNSGSSVYLYASAGLYSQNTAISSVKLTAMSGTFVTGSSFYLYGISNA